MPQHSELIEWCIVRTDRNETLLRHNEGAQSIFGLTRARKILKKLGPAWKIRHATSMCEPPEESEHARTGSA